MRVAIIGASGYSGLELVRIVLRHPELELVVVTSEQRAGQPMGESFPSLRGLSDLVLERNDPKAIAGRVDVAFAALPHSASAETVAALHSEGVRVFDISADFRLRDSETYRQWYGEHKAPELFGKAVYGLPEVYREELRAGPSLVAAPGCYPTSALLPLLPFLRAGLVETAPIFVDAKSGVSGAGRKLEEGFLFGEIDGNARAYKVADHRHGPEIEQEASLAAGEPVQVTLVPQLIPTIRGIITTVALRPKRPLTTAAARAVLAEAYAGEAFVRVLPEGETPSLQAVRGSNFCDVTAVADPRGGALVVLAALDNLVKGAGGQAVQCLNITQGWSERAGLGEAPWVP
jgi:N-acetyl-gamma-glutamyl-phosphate reductase